ncbi:HAMP domain-containing sensor histidine kinase [Bacillus smithii]|uniref:HAMP domain-containing sensor histidine kinase n=1 Tax=Bacillus smithii TaxID=1479 RepID=UPI0030C9CA5D
MKRRNSLLSKYLTIIITAIMLFPLSSILFSLLFVSIADLFTIGDNIYKDGTNLEKMWHHEAKALQRASDEQIISKLSHLKKTYSKADIFWVDSAGNTKFKSSENIKIPNKWSPSYVVQFMKSSYDSDPFTVVAFVGEKKDKGFIVFQVPRSEMKNRGQKLRDEYDYLFFIIVMIILMMFIFLSWIFFYRIRKRLLRLQKTINVFTKNQIPSPISIEKQDEIGQLEYAFNQMMVQLAESKKREKEEEELRRQLIANLSHDLRTPLTTIRGHAYRLRKEPLSPKGLESLELIDRKMNYLDQLIDNLVSYTLLTSGKYPFHPKSTDIIRLLRSSFALWYPVFENMNFEMEWELPEQSVYWYVDPQWMERILDNLFQNISRHAKEGKYVALRVTNENIIVIEDHGPGIRAASHQKGVGIGLSIVALMMKEMNLHWSMDTSETGTTILISESPIPLSLRANEKKKTIRAF